MDTKSPLTKRIELHFDRMTEKQVLDFIELHPSKMGFIKELVYVEFRKYKKKPIQYCQQHGLTYKRHYNRKTPI